MFIATPREAVKRQQYEKQETSKYVKKMWFKQKQKLTNCLA